MNKIATIGELLAIPDAQDVTEVVQVQGLGAVRVRALSLSEHREMRADCAKGEEFDWARWEALALVHGLAEPQVTYDQAAQLRRKAAGAIDSLLAAVFRVSGLTAQGQLSATAVDAAEESFRPGTAEGMEVPAGGDTEQVG